MPSVAMQDLMEVLRDRQRATEVERLRSVLSWWFGVEGHAGLGEEAGDQVGLLLAGA